MCLATGAVRIADRLSKRLPEVLWSSFNSPLVQAVAPVAAPVAPNRVPITLVKTLKIKSTTDFLSPAVGGQRAGKNAAPSTPEKWPKRHV